MVAEPVADAETSTPISEDIAEAPSVEDAVPVDPAVETPEAEAPPPPEPPAPPERARDSYTLAELDQLYREAKLTDPQLVERRETLRTREVERQREETRQVNARRQQAQERLAYVQNLEAVTNNAIQQGIQAEIDAALRIGREPDRELIAERTRSQIAQLVNQTRDLHLAPTEHALRQLLTQVYPTAQGQAYLEGLELGGLVQEMYKAGVAQGKVQGVPQGSVVKTQKEYDAEIKAAEERGYYKWRAENPKGAPPAVGRANGARSTPYEEWLATPTHERKAKYGDEVNQRMLEERLRQATGG